MPDEIEFSGGFGAGPAGAMAFGSASNENIEEPREDLPAPAFESQDKTLVIKTND